MMATAPSNSPPAMRPPPTPPAIMAGAPPPQAEGRRGAEGKAAGEQHRRADGDARRTVADQHGEQGAHRHRQADDHTRGVKQPHADGAGSQ